MKIENDLNWLEVEVFISAMKPGGQKNTSRFKGIDTDSCPKHTVKKTNTKEKITVVKQEVKYVQYIYKDILENIYVLKRNWKKALEDTSTLYLFILSASFTMEKQLYIICVIKKERKQDEIKNEW